ncbi:tRNA-guanine transglycosylase DpdA [Methanococcus aeolicus]|uniref:tRNA-guanine transglycosylase DpdA n=1 Tax=Methanococcus aeolicus TaxID=42879 RepID=UPI0021C9A83C|nr:tRNA-guanine transglycosylase DpdA [Methanococcus aeolicus]UXM84079.1 tRNA-guanine transglycosylase DpdA [Methanococcus aeolicus]
MNNKLKYFLPDWEDRLDPNFNFITDEFSEGHKKDLYNNGAYAHNLFKEVPYDGILFSLAVFQNKISLNNNDNNKEIYKIRNHTDIKNYLKIPKNSNLEVMGDCGAFGYVNEKEPPEFYSVENISKLYDKLNFDYGVAPDHLVVDNIIIKDENEKKKRVSLTQKDKDSRIAFTLENAEKFLKLHHKKGYNYIPIGTAQGYSVETYGSSVKSLIDMGYNYIALGALINYKTDFIIEILKEIQPIIIGTGVKLHLFGIARVGAFKKFHDLGVSSMDSASYFRKAWLKSSKNYITDENIGYPAIRIPQSTNKNMIKKVVDKSKYPIEKIKKMEKKSLEALLKYEKGELPINQTIDIIMEYDNIFVRNSKDPRLKEKYYKLLNDKPWEKCQCPICKTIGIQVVIFRGTNRNKRRGFHNIWALRKMMNKELI